MMESGKWVIYRIFRPSGRFSMPVGAILAVPGPPHAQRPFIGGKIRPYG
jgi:hypothetical protein